MEEAWPLNGARKMVEGLAKNASPKTEMLENREKRVQIDTSNG